MKVSLDRTITINQRTKFISRKENIDINNKQSDIENVMPIRVTDLSSVCNISFGARTDMNFLLEYADKFKCAYSGRPMISKAKAKSLYQKLEKRSNAQSAINLLQHLQCSYMHDIESIVFDILCDASHKNKRDFQDILAELAPQALARLKEKQCKILNSTNRLISTLSEPIAQQVIAIRDDALRRMEDDTFGRKIPLDSIRSIKAKDRDLTQLTKIYRKWYKLPCSSKDLDAFIVQYSKHSHLQIAKRLISSAVASVEHIKPHSRGGGSGLSNLILVSAQFNNSRSSMPLWEFMMLNPEIDIAMNLQQYINDVISEIHNKKSKFSARGWYPASIKNVIAQETKSSVMLDIGDLHLTHEQRRDIEGLKKLSRMFTIGDK